MSGTEQAIEAFTELANILSIVVTVSVVVTAVATLIRYLTKQVTKKAAAVKDEIKDEFIQLRNQIEYSNKETDQRSKQNETTITQMKWLLERMEKNVTDQVDSVRKDMERLEERRFKDVQMIRDRILRIENKIINGDKAQGSPIDHEDS